MAQTGTWSRSSKTFSAISVTAITLPFQHGQPSERVWTYASEIEPNGGRDENFVVIRVARKALVDVPEKTLGCSSCSISSSMLLKLDGLCKDSMIGKILHLQTMNISSISDKEYKILNVHTSVGFNGWKHTYIRYAISCYQVCVCGVGSI